ncbi:CsbD family protein [Bradyrhizobium liaoningense]|uniref:CsbD family protein n=1 Tax=Bradyrhizobium liaoningense TaxID=43992 RepID=UPI001BA609E4|nr:CsbD family protein [Bradyrhizobium liaoningense]MBR0903613.1 CsbD family protein [Bradyrhizobium liaoningense]
MGKTKGLQRRIVGKAKQAIGEIIGDQDLHEAGKAEAERGREEQDKPSDRNPLKKLNQLT